MRHYFSISLPLLLLTAGGTLRAATKPQAGAARAKANLTWTNADLERLSKFPGLISVVGQPSNDDSQNVSVPPLQSRTEDPAWYAARAATLNARLDAEQTDLRDFTRALDDVRELKSTAAGVNLAEDDIGITPEATIDILESRNSARPVARRSGRRAKRPPLISAFAAQRNLWRIL